VNDPVVLVDTNIISYQHNRHAFWTKYQPVLQGRILLMAAQTIAELRFGMIRRAWGPKRRATLESLIATYKTVYPNDAICTRWAEARAFADRHGRHLDSNDAWIAATALEFGIPLVTHNKKHFDFLEHLLVISENRV
jgi:tRNA(fMet)-specific endonuclease VapC